MELTNSVTIHRPVPNVFAAWGNALESTETATAPAHNGTYGRPITASETEPNAGYGLGCLAPPAAWRKCDRASVHARFGEFG